MYGSKQHAMLCVTNITDHIRHGKQIEVRTSRVVTKAAIQKGRCALLDTQSAILCLLMIPSIYSTEELKRWQTYLIHCPLLRHQNHQNSSTNLTAISAQTQNMCRIHLPGGTSDVRCTQHYLAWH